MDGNRVSKLLGSRIDMVGLKAIGIGGKTALYYLPNAMIREYIAILLVKKRSYMTKVLIVTFAFLLYAIMTSP